jgi:hypothetical protein
LQTGHQLGDGFTRRLVLELDAGPGTPNGSKPRARDTRHSSTIWSSIRTFIRRRERGGAPYDHRPKSDPCQTSEGNYQNRLKAAGTASRCTWSIRSGGLAASPTPAEDRFGSLDPWGFGSCTQARSCPAHSRPRPGCQRFSDRRAARGRRVAPPGRGSEPPRTRLALRAMEAPEALGVSHDFFLAVHCLSISTGEGVPPPGGPLRQPSARGNPQLTLCPTPSYPQGA